MVIRVYLEAHGLDERVLTSKYRSCQGRIKNLKLMEKREGGGGDRRAVSEKNVIFKEAAHSGLWSLGVLNNSTLIISRLHGSLILLR